MVQHSMTCMSWSWFSAAFAAVLLAGCSSHPPAPEKLPAPEYNYVIGPLDTLQITVWRNPDLSTTVPVRPDGKVSVPLVEDLNAIGKTPTQLARVVEKAMSKFIRGTGKNAGSSEPSVNRTIGTWPISNGVGP